MKIKAFSDYFNLMFYNSEYLNQQVSLSTLKLWLYMYNQKSQKQKL